MWRLGITILAAVSALHWSAVVQAAPHFGVVAIDSDGTGYLAVRVQHLQRGTPILVVTWDDAMANAQRAIYGKVARPLEGTCVPLRGVLEDSIYRYEVCLQRDPALQWGLGIAVLAPKLTVSEKDGSVTVRGARPGAPFTFRSCASTEGIHFTVWQGERRVWHQYYYLGYDIEPNCPDDEVGP